MSTFENSDTSMSQQEWASDFNESSMDCAISQLMIEKKLDDCAIASAPKLIGIEGVTGSGKTVLANALADNMENALLVDMYFLQKERGSVNNMAAIPDMTDRNVTYIIDEPLYCNLDNLAQAVDVEGTFILFFQSFEDVPKTLLQNLQRFNLSLNDGLIILKAH